MDTRTGEVMSHGEMLKRLKANPELAKFLKEVPEQNVRAQTRPNELCPCGSGKKFKRCCEYKT